MVAQTVTLTNTTGLHARPAALFMQEAAKYASAITVRSGGRAADGKSIIALLTLGAGRGAAITIEAAGEDEAAALAALASLVERNFGEE
jgi:phosphocarrier protein